MFKSISYLILVIIVITSFGACSNRTDIKQNSAFIEQEKKDIRDLIDQTSELFTHEDSLSRAIEILEVAHQRAKKINDYDGIAKISERLGKAHSALSNLPSAAGYYYTALKHAESLKDTQRIADSKMGLGLIMYTMHKREEAIDYFKESLAINQEVQISESQSGLVRYLIGLSYAKSNNLTKARKYLDQAKSVAINLNDTMRLFEIRLCLNNMHLQKDPSQDVLDEYENLFGLFEKSNERVGMGYSLEGKARYYLKTGDPVKAQLYANKSLQIVRKLNVIYPLQSILEVVTEAELQNGNYKVASGHLMDLQTIKDSIQGLNSAAKVALISADYKFDKEKANYNLLLKKQRRQNLIWIAVAGGLFLVVLMIIYLLGAVSKERKKSDALLLNILPEHTAKELKKFGKATAKTHKNVTIVFADVKNFTLIADGLGPNVIVLMLDKYFKALDVIAEKYQVEKIKTIGDAYMFVAGLNTASINSANLAVQTSLAMIDEIKEINLYMMKNYGTQFEFRFGMHTGDVVSGVVGQKKYAFDIWGDAVNIAARMEASSEPGQLNITEATYQLVKDNYSCVPRGEIEAKNKGKIKMYFVKKN